MFSHVFSHNIFSHVKMPPYVWFCIIIYMFSGSSVEGDPKGANCVYSIAIKANLLCYGMADKAVWRINLGQINEYLQYNVMFKAYQH